MVAAAANPIEGEGAAVVVVVVNVPPFHWVVMEEAVVMARSRSFLVEEEGEAAAEVVGAPIGVAEETHPWEVARDNRHRAGNSCIRAH